MKKRISALLIFLVLTVSMLCGCSDEKAKNNPAAAPQETSSAEDAPSASNEKDKGDASFSISKVKQGDAVSNFVVTSVEKSEADNGELISCVVVFEGMVTVYGECVPDLAEDGTVQNYKFNYTDDTAPYIPKAEEADKDENVLVLDAEKITELCGENPKNAALVISSLTYSYSSENGVVKEAEVSAKAESDYVIIE